MDGSFRRTPSTEWRQGLVRAALICHMPGLSGALRAGVSGKISGHSGTFRIYGERHYQTIRSVINKCETARTTLVLAATSGDFDMQSFSALRIICVQEDIPPFALSNCVCCQVFRGPSLIGIFTLGIDSS